MKILCHIFGHKQEKPKPKYKGYIGYSIYCVRCGDPLAKVIKTYKLRKEVKMNKKIVARISIGDTDFKDCILEVDQSGSETEVMLHAIASNIAIAVNRTELVRAIDETMQVEE